MAQCNFLLKLILFSIFVESYFCASVLTHGEELQFGNYKSWEHCPEGSLVNGFEVKADVEGKTFNDEEGMTGLRLFCADNKGNDTAVLSSMFLESGNWRGMNICPPNEWLNGFRIRIQGYRGVFKDDSAVNDFDMSCTSNTTFNGKGNSEGDWSEWFYCPKEEYICGLRTKVEDSFTADKAGLIAVDLRCCREGETIAWSFDYDNIFENSTDSNTYEDTLNQIGNNIKNSTSKGASDVENAFNDAKNTVQNWASEGASGVENAFNDAKKNVQNWASEAASGVENVFNDAKKGVEEHFNNESSSVPSKEGSSKTGEQIKFPQ